MVSNEVRLDSSAAGVQNGVIPKRRPLIFLPETGFPGSFYDLLIQQIDEQHEQDSIDHEKQDQGKNDLVGMHLFGERIGSSQQAVYDPGLPANLGGEPS